VCNCAYVPRRSREEHVPVWRRRGWPSAGQIGLAIVVGLVIAVFVGAITRHDDSKAVVPASTSASTSVLATSSTSTSATTTTSAPVARPTVASTVAPATTSTPAPPRLLPLTIAAASHQDSYERDTDFGDWIDVDGCQNTRATLLIRTSRVPVTFTSAKNCTVQTGNWTDPWSGAVTTVAHDFQIDHTVPLANAWRSGAWAWTHGQRVAYANDLADKDHLVPIVASENESKGDSGPDEWKPPKRSAWCRYALAWDRIKAKWHLTATPSEWTALKQMAATC
jgi:hypothetical protein